MVIKRARTFCGICQSLFGNLIKFFIQSLEERIKQRNRKRAEIWALKSFRDRSKKEMEDYIGRLYKYPNDARLFPMVAEALQHKMKRHIAKAGVKMIRVHDLRHSHVAYLIHQGVPPLVIKERLGHKDIGITLNTYGHLYPNEQKKLAEMLNGQKVKKDTSGKE